MRRRYLLLAPAIASAVACTLINSRDGLEGAPLDASTGSDGGDAGREAETSTPMGDATSDAFDAGADAASPITLYSGRSSPTGIAVFGSNVYWVERGATPGLLSAPSDGSGTPTHLDTVGDSIGDAFDLAFDGTYVYWGERLNGLVWRKAAGMSEEQCFPGAPSAAYLALGNGGVYVTDFREDDAGMGTGSVVFGPCPGSANVVFAQQPYAAGIAVASGSVVWARAQAVDAAAPGEVAIAALDAGTSSRLQQAQGQITGVAFDGTTVYWIEQNQRIVRMDITVRTPVPIYDAQQDFGESDVAVDDTAIYWTEQKNGLIRKLAK